MKKIPKEVQGLGGPIKVEVLEKLKKGTDGTESAGLWRAMKRTIQISSKQSFREQRRSLYHELVHAAVDDSGLAHLLTQPMEEALADLIAMARIIEDGL